MSAPDRIVFLVDDDWRICESVKDLLTAHGLTVMAFGSSKEYMRCARPAVPACLILDVHLPDINGLELQQELAHAQHPPIVFITGYGDIPSSVRAIKAGAVDFLPKPFKQEQLLSAITLALEYDSRERASAAVMQQLRNRYGSLTPRERDALPLIVSGLLNKQAAAQLGISLVTFQIHRGNVMRKMAARSLSELVRMAGKLGIPIAEPQSAIQGRPEYCKWNVRAPTCGSTK